MERTYDAFVDNGLFILANRLKKEIDEVKEEDVFNNIEKMSKEIFEFTNLKTFSNLKSMVFPNSPLTQGGKTAKDLEEKVKEEFSNVGNDICMKCGKERAQIFNKINKTYSPGIVALTMYNFSNNLQGINICPYCLALTVFSILNARVSRDVILFNATNNEFMKDYTKEIARENVQFKLIESNEKSGFGEIELLQKMWRIKNNVFYDGEIQIVKFNNMGIGMPRFEINTIDNRGTELLGKLKREGLEREFLSREYKLYDYLTKGKLTDRYIENIIKYNSDKGRDEIKCSKELFDFLNREVNKLEEKVLVLVNRLAIEIENLGRTEDDYKKIRNMGSKISAFENFLIDLNIAYYEKTNRQLFDEREFLKLVDRKNYRRVENLLIIKLIELKGDKDGK